MRPSRVIVVWVFGLVEAVVHSISGIVAGDISGAANLVESSLAQLVPMAIRLFADLLGLGGIAAELQHIIGDDGSVRLGRDLQDASLAALHAIDGNVTSLRFGHHANAQRRQRDGAM